MPSSSSYSAGNCAWQPMHSSTDGTPAARRAVRAGVAVLAVDLVLARVVLVAERDRLVRARARRRPRRRRASCRPRASATALSNSAGISIASAGSSRLAAPSAAAPRKRCLRGARAGVRRRGGPEGAGCEERAAPPAHSNANRTWGRVPESHPIARERAP